MLKLENVTRTFGQNTALKNINISFDTGTIYAIIGPNGAGKTTLINMMCNTLYPSAGTITLDNMPLDHKDNAKHKIYVVLAGDRGLYWRLKGIENVYYFLSLKGITKKKAEVLISKSIDVFGSDFPKLLEKRVEELSFGQKKKIQLFIGFISMADYLIIDEITEGLDVDSREDMKIVLQTIADKGRTVIFATHDLPFAACADKGIFINNALIHNIVDIHEGIDILDLYKEMRGAEYGG